MNSGQRTFPHSRSKRDRLADHVRERIHDGRFPAGERLPTEGDLALQHNVSRNTVRDAMKALENEGLVVIRHGSGTYVRQCRPIIHLATSVSGGIDSERFSQGYQPATKVAGYDRVQERIAISIRTAQGTVADQLQIGEDRPVNERQIVERRCDRLVDGALWQQQRSCFPASIALNTRLMISRQLEQGTREVLRELGYEQTWSYDLVGARMPEPRERASFDIPSGVPLLVQTRVAYAGAASVRVTETLMPADRHILMYAEGDVDEGVLVSGTDVNLVER